MTESEHIDLNETFRAERDGSARWQPAADFSNVLRDFTTTARLIAAMPADERAELRKRLDAAMARNDQQTALARLMTSLVIPQAVQ